MNKNVHFVNTVEKDNEEFRIYDIAFLSDNIILSSDIIGQLIFYEIQGDEFNLQKKDVKNIYPLDDLDNLISIYSIDTLNNEEIILGSSKGEVVYLKNNEIEEKYTNLKSDKFSKVKFISENNFISGDFKGNLTLFDKRQKSYIKIFKEQSEEITDILYDPNKPNFLLSSSIDSTLCVYDINKLSLYALSDKLDEELNCLLSYKNGSYILCGSGEGNVLIFNWDWFGDFKDMIKGHPEGINDMDKFDDNILLTGAEDGLIRICTMFPKAVRGILKNKNNKINKDKDKDSIKDVNKIKISNDPVKITNPGYKKLYRFYDKDTGYALGDVIALHDEIIPADKYVLVSPTEEWKRFEISNYRVRELQKPIFLDGALVYSQPNVHMQKDYSQPTEKDILKPELNVSL